MRDLLVLIRDKKLRLQLQFSRLYTHKKWNYTHNSENLKLMYQLKDSRLLISEHNSIVFMHIEILNHIFANL